MAEDVGSAIDDEAEAEVDSAMEEGVGSMMEDEATEGGGDDQVETVMAEEVCGLMDDETEEGEADDEMEDDGDDGAAGMIGSETEEEVDEAKDEVEEGLGSMMTDKMAEEEDVDNETEDEVEEDVAGMMGAETVEEVDQIGGAIGGRIRDEEGDDNGDDASSHTEPEDQAQQGHSGSETGHGNERQASHRPDRNEAEGTPDLPLNLGSHLLEFWGCVAGTHRHGDCDEDDGDRHEYHRSLEAINRITGRLPNVIGKPGFLVSDNSIRARRLPRDWQLAFQGPRGLRSC